MWMATKYGFYSTVANRDREDGVVVRARARQDLENLCELGKLDPGVIQGPDPAADYRWRVFLGRDQWQRVAGLMVADIDYPNFKNAVGARDRKRAHIYSDVWLAMLQIQEDEKVPAAKQGPGLREGTPGEGARR